ncbi:MAG: response regulator transcription factor [Opitutaceae bacterium]
MNAVDPPIFRVLVIEKNNERSSCIVKSLREHAFIADSVVDGEEGLYRALHWDYDAVVVAQELPQMNGRSVVAELREVKPIPILMLSEHLIKLNVGAYECLPQPFAIGDILASLKGLLYRHAKKTSSILEAGTLQIDTERREVYLENELIPTTTKEYHFIELFVRKKGRVVTREYIYQNLFNAEADVSNNLDVYIYKLRAKLGNHFIKTRRGLGYILECHD